jgi:hypothetical protein
MKEPSFILMHSVVVFCVTNRRKYIAKRNTLLSYYTVVHVAFRTRQHEDFNILT